jgi:hypothetical protein
MFPEDLLNTVTVEWDLDPVLKEGDTFIADAQRLTAVERFHNLP